MCLEEHLPHTWNSINVTYHLQFSPNDICFHITTLRFFTPQSVETERK